MTVRRWLKARNGDNTPIFPLSITLDVTVIFFCSWNDTVWHRIWFRNDCDPISRFRFALRFILFCRTQFYIVLHEKWFWILYFTAIFLCIVCKKYIFGNPQNVGVASSSNNTFDTKGHVIPTKRTGRVHNTRVMCTRVGRLLCVISIVFFLYWAKAKQSRVLAARTGSAYWTRPKSAAGPYARLKRFV